LDESFFSALSKFLKYSHRKDKTLFSRVKAEFPEPIVYDHSKRPSLSFPKLEGTLAWVTKAWERARKPRGRPQVIQKHLFIGSWIDLLAAPHVVFEVTEKGSPSIRRIRPLMSFVDALGVLQGDYPRVGQAMYTPSGRKRKFGALARHILDQIHEGFKNSALDEFGVIPSLEYREVQRIMSWYRRWSEAKSRIRGNKVRAE
jgi:hypothetical protein